MSPRSNKSVENQLDVKSIKENDIISESEDRNSQNEIFQLPLPLLLIDFSGKVIFRNSEALRLFDCLENDEPDFSIFDLVPPDYQIFLTTLLEASRATKTSQNGELIFVLSCGKQLKTKIFVNQNNVNGDELFSLVIADLSDIKQVYDEKLFEVELKYKELAENINEGIYLTERSYITMVNSPLLDIFGFDQQEVVGRRVWEFVVPEQRRTIRDVFIRKVKNLDTSPVEVECLRKDGSRFWAEIRISIFKDQHKIFGVFSDITPRKNVENALKESEIKYRSVVNAMNDGIIMRDYGGKVITWNQAAEAILDLNGEELKNLSGLFPGWKAIQENGDPFNPGDHPATISLSSGKSIHHTIMGIHNKKGVLRWIRINSVPVAGENGFPPKAVVTSFSDITHLKNTENKLREINAIKDKLFSIVAHDLKSPYNAQMGFLELLMDETINYTPEERRHFVQMLYESARQSFALLDNLLLWSRNQTGKIPFQPKEISINELVDNSIRFFGLSASVKNIKIKSCIGSNELKVKADYEMTNTVLRNLMANAIKFTPAGGTVKILCKAIDDEQLKISVKDNGVGIPKELQGKLFKPNNINSTPGTENEKGTGLGLIICKEFVERNGGKIGVRSTVGKGTTFYFTLKNATITQKCEGTCMKNLGAVYAEIMKKPEIRKHFTAGLAATFHQGYKTFDRDALHEFSRMLNEIVHRYHLEPLIPFTHNFSYDCLLRDQNQVNICFSEFEKLMDKLEQNQRFTTKAPEEVTSK